MNNSTIRKIIAKVTKVSEKHFTNVIYIAIDTYAVIYPKNINQFQLNFINIKDQVLLKQPGYEYIHGLYSNKLSDLFEAITQMSKSLEIESSQYQLYKLKPKKDLKAIPNAKDFWYYHNPRKILLKLRPVRPFSNDLVDMSGVRRSDVDKFLVTPEGEAVHIDAVNLI